MAARVHVGDVGTLFRPRFLNQSGIVDISTATKLIVIFNRPDGSAFIRDMVPFTDGKDGVGKYISVEGDIDAIGTWSMEGYVETPDGHWHTDVKQFPVEGNLPRG